MKKIVFFLTLLIVSCSKQDSIIEPSSNDKEFSINDAKEFYESRSKGSRENGKTKNFEILWNNSGKSKSKDSKEEFISVPYIDLDGIAVEIDDERKKGKDKEDSFTADVKTNLIFKKTNGKVEGFILYLIRDEDAYAKKKESLITMDNFDGYAYLHDLDYNLVESSLFKNGKITHSTISNKKARPSDYPLRVCTYYYTNVSSGGTDYGTRLTDVECSTISVSEESGSGSVTLYAFTSTIGGGSSGGTSAPLTPLQSWELYELNPTEKAYFNQNLT